MLPAGRSVSRAGAQLRRPWVAIRHNHRTPDHPNHKSDLSTSADPPSLTGSAKLFAEAAEEDERILSTRDHLKQAQGPVWDGEESTHDAVLRMLVDAHKPLRTGEGIQHDTADKKIKRMVKGIDMAPRSNTDGKQETAKEQVVSALVAEEVINPHRTTVPPHLHRPWHATYTGTSQSAETPKVKYGTFIKRRADGDALTNLLELQLPPNADGKTRARVREARRSQKAMGRFDKAREGAVDYRLGLGLDGGQMVEMDDDVDEDGEKFRGNRQVRGSSVLGAQKGGASGLRAWGGLVEDRIQVRFIVTLSMFA